MRRTHSAWYSVCQIAAVTHARLCDVTQRGSAGRRSQQVVEQGQKLAPLILPSILRRIAKTSPLVTGALKVDQVTHHPTGR